MIVTFPEDASAIAQHYFLFKRHSEKQIVFPRETLNGSDSMNGCGETVDFVKMANLLDIELTPADIHSTSSEVVDDVQRQCSTFVNKKSSLDIAVSLFKDLALHLQLVLYSIHK